MVRPATARADVEPDPGAEGTVADGALTGRRVLLGITGGIAAYKAALVARLIVRADGEVDTVLTAAAGRFVGAATFEGITGRPVRSDVFGDVPGRTHVQLARGADAVLVYPATANLLARAAAGLADDLLTTVLLAATCPVLMAPAMHGEMWANPATAANAATLRDRGVRLLGPATGELMGGDVGAGRVVEPEVALEAVLGAAATRRDLDGRRVVVTAGGTREPLDPVRFLGNRSTGRMGFAVAAVAARRGADVRLISAPTHLRTPAGVDREDVETAAEMRDAVIAASRGADAVIKAAAVADFRPASPAGDKLSKDHGPPTVELEPTADILAELGAQPADDRPLLVGFAAETTDPEERGRAKLEAKGVDLLVVNDVGRDDVGFGSDDNEVVILAADGARLAVPRAAKSTVADRLLDEVVARLA